MHAPIKGGIRVTSKYGRRNGKTHNGVDIVPAKENALHHAVHASENGKVVFRGTASGYGNVLVVKLSDGKGLLYAHLNKKGEHFDLRKNDTVKEGQIIARIGNTGVSTGPHLHLEYLGSELVKDIEKNSSTTSLGISASRARLNPSEYLKHFYKLSAATPLLERASSSPNAVRFTPFYSKKEIDSEELVDETLCCSSETLDEEWEELEENLLHQETAPLLQARL